MEVQIFGLKKSAATRAAERFFKERRVKIHFVDLAQRPIAKGELARFTQKFGLTALLDVEGKAYEALNLPYLRLSEDSLVQKAIDHPELLKLPLVRMGKFLSYGDAQGDWRTWMDTAK
ncbi:ArsC/Spx/MgsR family protein [Deinococcus yavapaiensis]|uniref:Arsenate reductase-like glutaredoxin family protein n=1 Tax=Deinococcus yavapaiensis KR-236 TaxID=694435 RepID=A0A318S6V0_9DEIO|nr:ArsC/Spx/MgsR family protein [Deinococcus yavapaiensis]PYE54494.1 arsenate reductase-like glutaredoxin family protein [Deinococcus yavapaiensis KR-236]